MPNGTVLFVGRDSLPLSPDVNGIHLRNYYIVTDRQSQHQTKNCFKSSYMFAKNLTHHTSGLFVSIYFLWHMPLEGQFSQPHPQEDFPFFLSCRSFITINVTKTAKMRMTRMLPQLF